MENIDLTKILKDCPKGTLLYSTVTGPVRFIEINENSVYPIKTDSSKGTRQTFTKQGTLFDGFPDTECVLFPSKDNRDWNTFKVPIEKFDITTLIPFVKVLVRDTIDERWHCSLFSYLTGNERFKFRCIESTYRQCIPYNDETKHLVGTINTPSEKYINW